LIAFLVSPLGKQIRDRTGVNLSVFKLFSFASNPFKKQKQDASVVLKDDNDNEDTGEKGGNGDGDANQLETGENNNEGKGAETMNLIKEGLKMMFMDVIIQLCMSVSMYLALKTDSAVAYQITALQSELPGFGIAYSFGMAQTAQLFGPLLLTYKLDKLFVKFVILTMVCVLLLCVLIVATSVPSLSGLTFYSGANACAYASSNQCVDYFTNVFGENARGGDFTLFFTYNIFPALASIDSILVVLRAFLLTFLDFDYMLYSSIAASIAYIEAICVVKLAATPFQDTAIGFFGAAYVPQLVLTCLFAFRLVVVARRIAKGKDGPYRKERISSVMNKSTVEATGKMLQEEEESAVVEDSDSKMNTAQ